MTSIPTPLKQSSKAICQCRQSRASPYTPSLKVFGMSTKYARNGHN